MTDLNAWFETYKDTFNSFTKAQQDGFRALERFARFNHAVAGDVLEAGLAQTQAVIGVRAAVGGQAITELLHKQGRDRYPARREDESPCAGILLAGCRSAAVSRRLCERSSAARWGCPQGRLKRH